MRRICSDWCEVEKMLEYLSTVFLLQTPDRIP